MTKEHQDNLAMTGWGGSVERKEEELKLTGQWKWYETQGVGHYGGGGVGFLGNWGD